MKRCNEVPAELLAYMEKRREDSERAAFKQDRFCYMPVRAVKMKVLGQDREDHFRTVIVPPMDIYVANKAKLKEGFLKRDALSFYIADTKKAFPYGHVYSHSGCICLGTLFVPSAIPERSPAMPLDTLFLHNDRNLGHGGASLHITVEQSEAVCEIMGRYGINLNGYSRIVIMRPNENIIKHDEVWNLSADVVDQKSLPDALDIMHKVYSVIFREEEKKEEETENV